MRRIRPTDNPPLTVEMTPLLDVVFLLLTFFIFSMLVLRSVDTLGITLPNLEAAQNNNAAAPITIAIDTDGLVLIDGQQFDLPQTIAHINTVRTETPDAPVLIAGDIAGPMGSLFDLMDAFRTAGIQNFEFLAAPNTSNPVQPQQ